jgi:hypothetical protein
VQRLFSYFPSALPGVGLLQLRLVLCGFLLIDANRVRLTSATWPTPELGVGASLLLAGLASLGGLGFLTPFASLSILAVQLAVLIGDAWPSVGLGLASLAGTWQLQVCQAAIAITLMLTGPGAYSLDARLFGRREISFPPRPDGRHS